MKPVTMRKIRLFHHYLGLFFAPMILMFAVSGALQTFRLQDARPDAPAPSRWIVWLASVHTDQSVPHEKKPKAAPALALEKSSNAPIEAPVHRPSPLPLKVFVVLLSIGLALSTLLGVTIAINNRATRRNSLALLGVGIALPLLLLFV